LSARLGRSAKNNITGDDVGKGTKF
jgi:hypothetical protein